jgi:hypothetical protein
MGEKKNPESSLQTNINELQKFFFDELQIHNLKLKPWNNSYEMFLQHNLKTMHLKDDAKQNNNKHKQNTIKGGEALIYGCVNLIVASWKEK